MLRASRQGRQLLVHVLVQLQGDVPTFGFLRFDELSGQVLNLLVTEAKGGLALPQHLFRVLAFGDVEHKTPQDVRSAVPALHAYVILDPNHVAIGGDH